MPLTLEIVSEHRDIVGDDAVRVFRNKGGTIGRAFENDWILPDPEKYISARHATIDVKGGAYFLADTSSNGVYVNGSHEPLGRGNPRRLFNGDRLRLGDFEITVTIDEGEDLELPEEPKPTVVPDNIEQLVDETALKTGVALLDEDELTGDNEFQSALFGEGRLTVNAPLDSEPEPEPLLDEVKPKKTTITIKADDLFDCFLDGLGLTRADLHPSTDIADVMQNAGQVLREFVAGTDQLIAGRANYKQDFSLEQTTVLPRHNNPLKLSENTTDSIKQLLVGRSGEYLGPRDAVREVCRDLQFHQEAFVEAMAKAFNEFSDRFDPDELVTTFDKSKKGGALLGGLNQRKYWQLYTELYPVLTERGGARFPQIFVEEFVSAYERCISEAKRGVSADTSKPRPDRRQSAPDFEKELESELEDALAASADREAS